MWKPFLRENFKNADKIKEKPNSITNQVNGQRLVPMRTSSHTHLAWTDEWCLFTTEWSGQVRKHTLVIINFKYGQQKIK